MRQVQRAFVVWIAVAAGCAPAPPAPQRRAEPPDDPPAMPPPPVPRAPSPDAEAAPPMPDARVPERDASPQPLADAGAGPEMPGVSADAAGPCLSVGVELCEDFESGKINPALWTVGRSRGTLAVEEGRTNRGKYALHVKLTPGEQADVFVDSRTTFPARDNHFFARAFMFLSPELPTGNVHQRIVSVTGRNAQGVDFWTEVGIGARKEFLGNYLVTDANGWREYPKGSRTLVPVGKWFCIEIESDARAALVTKIYLDDTELTDIRTTATGLAPPQFRSVKFGPQQAHRIPSLADVWIDDIRVSSQRIGCQR